MSMKLSSFRRSGNQTLLPLLVQNCCAAGKVISVLVIELYAAAPFWQAYAPG
jgi:hypothetical protein